MWVSEFLPSIPREVKFENICHKSTNQWMQSIQFLFKKYDTIREIQYATYTKKRYGKYVTEVYEAERNWRGKSSQLIGQQQENKANWILWFRLSHRWRNLFHFSQREKNGLSIVQIFINSSFSL